MADKEYSASERIKICRSCPTQQNKTLAKYERAGEIMLQVTQCKLCNCIMELKTKIPWKHCDNNHW